MQSTLFNTTEQEFFNAIKVGNINKMTHLLTTGVSITAKAPLGGKQALHIACEAQQKVSVDKLLELGADVNVTTDRGFTPLHVAAQQGHQAILLSLLKAGALLEPVTDRGMGTTPLQEAAHQGHLIAVNILIAAGADTHYRDKQFGLTAADLAKQAHHHDVAIALLGYQKAFIKRVSTLLNEWAQVFLINTPQHDYYQNLRTIPEMPEADDYFKALKTKLDQNYQAIKNDVQKLRTAIIAAMKQYNADKVLAQEVKAILSESKAASIEQTTHLARNNLQ